MRRIQHLILWLAFTAYLMDATDFFLFAPFSLVMYLYIHVSIIQGGYFYAIKYGDSNKELNYFRLLCICVFYFVCFKKSQRSDI